MAIEKLTNASSAGPERRVEKKFDKDGNLKTVSIYEDVNGDGKLDLAQVTVFSKSYDGSKTYERVVKDFDGDGYNDYQLDTSYDRNGKKISEKEIYEEDINKVKARNHFEHEIYNREMTTHQSGIYMM